MVVSSLREPQIYVVFGSSLLASLPELSVPVLSSGFTIEFSEMDQVKALIKNTRLQWRWR